MKTQTILTMMIHDFDSYPGVEECDVYGCNIDLPQTGSDEPVNDVKPCWIGVEQCDGYEDDVVLMLMMMNR